MTIIKVIGHNLGGYQDGRGADIVRGDCIFRHDAHCTEYDWCVVYDDFPRNDVGTISNETEALCCPPGQTILVTAEPPSIKMYPNCYTRQFGYVLTTHHPKYLPHPNHRYGEGCLYWMANYPKDEVFAMPEYEKTQCLSTVCSAKQQKHTQHFRRYQLVSYLAQHLDNLDWYGRGVKPLDRKYDSLSPYKYHIAVENYIAPHHWSDKLSDPLLGHCLTFYAGDPVVGNILPPESIIPIPVDDPPKALEIIREAIANNEYEKRLPAIMEARRRVVEQYNFYNRIVELIHEHQAKGGNSYEPKLSKGRLMGRHTLRRNPINALSGALSTLRYKVYALFSKEKH